VKVIGYARVSTEGQADRDTISIQREALNSYATGHAFDLCEIFSDKGISGGLVDRPGLSELFDRLETAPDVKGVLIFKLDRLARDLYIQEHLIKKLEGMGKTLISIQDPDLDSKDPMRKAFRQFMGVVAELEKSFITMRMSVGRIHKARKGGYAGGAPGMGYQVKDGDLVIDEARANTVRQIFALKEKGLGLREIARVLNEMGIPTARGGQWHAGTIKYVLGNRLYQGILSYKAETAARADLAILRR
jgi:site-specific DNA recombinase